MDVSPKQIEFSGDFKTATPTYVTLRNPGSTPLAFKIKTNAAKVYSVKPNVSVVEPQLSVKVSITLPALRQSLPANYRSKHKFLIVSLPSDGASSSEVATIWPELQKKYSDSLKLDKVSVNYVNLNEKAGSISEAASPAKLNGRSKRISKFVPNGSASKVPNGSAKAPNGSSGGAAAAAAGGAAVATAAGAGAAYGARLPADESYSYNNQASRQLLSYNEKESVGDYSQAPRSAAPQVGGDFTRELEELSNQNERLIKKVENIEKLAVIALMILSFILGKLMV